MEGKGADEGEAVYVAEMHFSGKEEEGAEEEEEEDWAGEVGVIHYVLGDGVERVEYRERLALDMPEIDPQFLQQWRLPVISLCSKCRYPACSQSPLLSHAPTDALPAETGRRAKSAGAWVGL